MGFVLSILYFATSYLTPGVVFGPLAQYRVELILAALIFFVSLPKLSRSFISKTPQSIALPGLAIAVLLSVLVAERWAGGAVQAMQRFIPMAYGYFLVCLHCNTKRKLQVVVLMLLFVCLFVIAHGGFDLLHGVGTGPVQAGWNDRVDAWNGTQWSMEHPYIFFAGSESGLSWLFRLKGLGMIGDPNDFGQLIVCEIPLVFIFWRPKRILLNIAFVLLPVSALLLGVYLTHSRGALLALIAMAVVFGQRRIGTVPSLLLAGGLFAGAMALNFTGGRQISAASGIDRTDLWGAGLQLLKSHPFFGVGLGSMADYAGLTAHNSLVVCAAELGLVGLYFWCLFLFPTIRDALAVSSPAKLSEGQQIIPEDGLFPATTTKVEVIVKAEVNRLGRLVVLSLTGFLVAGWFLSRAFVMTFFLLGGLVEVVYELALQRGMIAPRMRLGRVLPYAGVFAISLILLMYVMLLILNRFH